MLKHFSVLCLLLCLAGCGKSDNKVTISGKVTFNKEPVGQGTISFIPVDGRASTEEAVISQGEYSLTVPPGKKTVKITGTRVIGSRPAYEGVADSPMIEERQQYIPANFNDQSTLQKDISKTEVMNFDLQ